MLHNFAIHGVLKHLTTYGCKRDRSVVTMCTYISLLKIGDMLAMSQSDGTTPVLRDLLKTSVKAASSVASFMILTGTSYGPEILCSSRSLNSFNTPSIVISIVGIDGKL